MKKKFFLSSIGGLLAQNVASCIRDQFPEAQIIGSDTHTEHAGSNFADRVLIIERVESEKFLSSLSANLEEHKPHYYLPLNESELRLLSSLSSKDLEDLFKETQIVWSGKRVLDTFLDKESTMIFLDTIQLKRPKSYLSNNFGSFKYPLIVKPRNGSGSKSLFLCNNLEELKSSLVFVKSPIIQEFIPDQEGEYTVGVFAKKGSGVRTISFRRRLSPGGGTSWCETYYDSKLAGICEAIAKAIDLDGSINVQLRKYEGEYYIFEINPRFSSTVHIRSKLGFNDVLWSLEDSFDYKSFDASVLGAASFAVYQSEVKID
jgi:carbamoyl-phosphate synthase large subunit